MMQPSRMTGKQRTRTALACIFLLSFIFGQTVALPPPKCDIGFGVTVPYDEAESGQCKKCQVSNCQYCLYDYRSCYDDISGPGCKPGYGLNEQKNKCLSCKGSKCGVCDNNYQKCKRKIADCRKKVSGILDAKKVSRENITENNDSCLAGIPYFSGNGYTSRFVPLIKKNGVCVDCNANHFLFLKNTGRDFCYLDSLMREAAVNAFKKNPKCAYPEGVSLTLMDFCFDDNRELQFSAFARYRGKYCGKTQIIYVDGSTEFRPDSYKEIPNSIAWRYATE